MSEGVRDTELLDLIIGTREYLPKAQLGVPLEYTDYPILNRVLTMGWSITGRDPEIRVKVGKSKRAHMERLYQGGRTYNKTDMLKKAKSRWGHLTTDWIIDRREDIINKGEEEIVNVLKLNKLDAMLDMAELIEELSWQTEKTDNESDLSLKGVPYWITPGPNQTITPQGTGSGFVGAGTVDRDGVAITSPGGISAVDYELWRNYYDTFTAMDLAEDDGEADSFIAALTKCFYQIDFKAPRIVSDLESNNPLANYRIYTVLNNILAYEKWIKAHNQNIGYDASKYMGKTPFNGCMLERCQQLENLAAPSGTPTTASKLIYGVNPTYLVNWNNLKPFALKGNEMYEHDPFLLQDQPNTAVVVLDHSMNFLARNRRTLALLSEKQV